MVVSTKVGGEYESKTRRLSFEILVETDKEAGLIFQYVGLYISSATDLGTPDFTSHSSTSHTGYVQTRSQSPWSLAVLALFPD